MKARKIGPVEILKKINDNAYRLRLPDHIHTTDVFNVKHLIPYHGNKHVEEGEGVNSGSNSFQSGVDDAAHTRILGCEQTLGRGDRAIAPPP